jgi:hypothetical protein
MLQVFYPGHAGQPFLGEYAIVIDNSDMFSRADIVLVSRHEHGGAGFYSSALGRDAVLNRILANDLNGIRLQWIRLFVLAEKSASASTLSRRFAAVEVKDIVLDTDDFIAKGNPCTVCRRNLLSRLFTGVSREISYWSGHVVGGCARFSTSLRNTRQLDPTEIETLCARIGLASLAPEPAQSSTRPHRQPAARNTWSTSSYH